MIDNPEALLTEEACDEGFVYETKPFNVLEAHSSQSIEAELRSKVRALLFLVRPIE
jgi:hypothetical protein